jgi:hypothetical protein
VPRLSIDFLVFSDLLAFDYSVLFHDFLRPSAFLIRDLMMIYLYVQTAANFKIGGLAIYFYHFDILHVLPRRFL